MNEYFFWQHKTHEVFELRYWTFLSSIGGRWDEEIETAFDELYKERRNLGVWPEDDCLPTDFVGDIVSGWFDQLSLGYPADNKPGREEFMEYLEDERVGFLDPPSSDFETI